MVKRERNSERKREKKGGIKLKLEGMEKKNGE